MTTDPTLKPLLNDLVAAAIMDGSDHVVFALL